MIDGSPHYLIAVPQLGDPNFAHKIILMLHHDAEGALGLVINDPTELDLGTFSRSNQLSCSEKIGQYPVYRGGPVSPDQGWNLHANDQEEESKELVAGLYISGSQTTMQDLLEQGDTTMRLMLGYAGWSGGQLEEEMAQGAWITTDASAEHTLRTDPEDCWKAVLNDMGIDPAAITLGGALPSY